MYWPYDRTLEYLYICNLLLIFLKSNNATNNSEIAENSENVIPTEKKSVNSQLSNTLLKPSQNPSEINTHTSSSDDQDSTAPKASSTSSTSSSSSSSEIPGPGSPSQRSSSRQSSISRNLLILNQIIITYFSDASSSIHMS